MGDIFFLVKVEEKVEVHCSDHIALSMVEGLGPCNMRDNCVVAFLVEIEVEVEDDHCIHISSKERPPVE
jgi:hypothetical protein